MTTNNIRTTELRELLVHTASGSTPEPTPRWRLAALVAAVALASGVTGAVSAAAITQSSPYDDKVTASLALSVARANSVAAGSPHYVAASGGAAVDLGERPTEATGVAIRTACTEPGTVTISIDGRWTSSITCDEESPTGGGGGVTPVEGSGDHAVTFSSAGTGYESWLVWVTEPPMPESSPQQAAEIADGVATREEYLAAFNRFVGCMSGAGFEVLGNDTTQVIIEYAITADAVQSGADELCYVSQFRDVDTAWQLQNEDSSETARVFRECLEENGITPSATMAELTQQLEDAGISVESCLR